MYTTNYLVLPIGCFDVVQTVCGYISNDKMLLLGFNPLGAKGIYICTINALRISARSALRSYVKGASPAPLESALDRLSAPASGLGIGHTRTKI